jgi:hypothetical protein
VLSRDGAIQSIIKANREPQVRHFYGVPLVVQDPFDLEHNVCKIVNRGMFERLKASFRNAATMLQRELSKESQGSILAILEKPSKSANLHARELVITLSHIRNLLLQRGLTLKERLDELELPETRQGLEELVLKEVLHVLSSRFMFEESAHVDEGEVPEEDGGEGVGEGGEGDSMRGEEEEREDMERSVGEERGREEEEMERSVGEAEEEGRGKESTGLREEAMEVEEGDSEVVKRKRLPSDQDQPLMQKKCKIISHMPETFRLVKPHPLDPSKPRPFGYICSAYRNTWTGTRKARRHRQKLQSPQSYFSQNDNSVAESAQQSHPEMVPLSSDTTPILQLRVALGPLPPDSRVQETVRVNLTMLQGDYDHFYQFMAVLKKNLWSGQTSDKQTGTWM